MARKKRFKSRKQSTLNKIETKVYNILKSLGVSFKVQTSVDRYNVDFLVEDKYIIECFGDFWHCNPQKYKPDFFNRGKKKTAEEIWQRDNCRKNTFEQLGYKFLNLWESELGGSCKSARKKIRWLLEGE